MFVQNFLTTFSVTSLVSISVLSNTFPVFSQNFSLEEKTGVIYAEVTDNQQKLEEYNRAIQLNPQDAQAYKNRGDIYTKLKEYQKAVADYTQAIKN
jgi:tetratricopeptide (TPR) repeat protein